MVGFKVAVVDAGDGGAGRLTVAAMGFALGIDMDHHLQGDAGAGTVVERTGMDAIAREEQDITDAADRFVEARWRPVAQLLLDDIAG